MRSPRHSIKFGISLAVVVIVMTFINACGSSGNKPPIISSIKANHDYVYPLGTSEIQCIAADPEGHDINFKWSCTDGSFTGTGPIVTWKAPNSYGDCHIMVVVEDENGNSTHSTLTIGVVVNENKRKYCCN